MTLDPLRLTVDAHFGELVVTLLAPNRQQKVTARRLERCIRNLADDDAEAEAALTDEIEELLVSLVHRVARDGGDTLTGERAQEWCKEQGLFYGGDGGALLYEVCFRRWSQTLRTSAGGPARNGDGPGDRGGAVEEVADVSRA